MSVRVMQWVWEHSKSKGNDRLTLLAIADNAHEDGGGAFMKTATLSRKTGGLSERTIQTSTKRLAALGELVVYPNAGPNGVNRYRVIMTPAESAPPQNLHPAESAVPPEDSAGVTPQNLRHPPAESAPITVIEPSVEPPEIKTSSAASAKPAASKRGTRIPDDFAATPEMVAWVRDRCPLVDGRHETEKFVLYWQAKASGAVKLDWVKTWKTWMLNAADRLPTTRPARSSGGEVVPFTGRDSPRRSTTDDRVNQAREAGRAVAARMTGGSL